MEFPDLGQYCSIKTCNRLDFLPMKCNSCAAVLCKDHIKYNEHQCPSFYRKNIQVPICNQVVPLQNRDQSPDYVVSTHIARECKSNLALKKRQRIYSYKCSFTSCKQYEAVEIKCYKCLKTFCVKHRHPDDHKCQEFENPGRVTNLTSAEAIECMKKTNVIVTNNNESNNASVNDNELLTLTIKLSLNQRIQEQNDFLLAKALQESEQEEVLRPYVTPMVAQSNHVEQVKAKKHCCSIQ